MSEIRSSVLEAGPPPRARKRFGQHFLHDRAVIAHILHGIDAQPADHLVEIGPGPGALTAPLLATGAMLDAIEVDRDLAATLRQRFAAEPRFQLHCGDALRFDFATLAGNAAPLRLIGNLPYNISTPLLFHVLADTHGIRDMHFMLQKEVVDRLTAQAGSRDYGRLTVAVAARAEAVKLFDVGPGAFTPPPKVWSSVVRITPRTASFPIPDFKAFDQIVAAAFSQRRKTLANALRKLLNGEQIMAAGIDPKLRAERLTPADFGRLAEQWLANHPAPNANPGANPEANPKANPGAA
ncbi:MAG: 16S rRNA (adenine(1518)-N(6)/adenine(1519)-N(6))-dimethyltransferase RsmA [Nevskiaceae bacterium]|nr:MAG: 16S rRNA (adenine(1518)-N(6)/adenine(1519)-N(6))-dimethyltransferase RsmA [Nevskiaceae bacterium]TBR71546.1 MAG: 16S rRNA (adenine(1518)-N(6)/adenine(1519)-N(6))-dimethyltransferase RsmA [Nevskiaceae bacterium]